MAEVRLTRALLALFPESPAVVQVDAATVGGVVQELNRRWPGMRDRLCAPGPAIRPHLNIFVDGEISDIDTEVQPNSVVHVLTAVSGG